MSPEQESYFDLFFHRDSAADDGQILFIREGIIISDVRPRRCPGFRGLVVIDNQPLATFLGDAENPSHTQWQKELVRGRYSYHAATLAFVVDAIPSVVRILSEEHQHPDPTLLSDLFYLPSEQSGDSAPTSRAGPRGSPDDPAVRPHIPPPRPKPYRLTQTEGGFLISRENDAAVPRPCRLEVLVAYCVRHGSAFKRYNPADFDLGKAPIKVEVTGADILECERMRLVIRITQDDFKVRVTGFDPNRDLETAVTVLDDEREVTPVTTQHEGGDERSRL